MFRNKKNQKIIKDMKISINAPHAHRNSNHIRLKRVEETSLQGGIGGHEVGIEAICPDLGIWKIGAYARTGSELRV
jgi:hypothetical protein